MNPPSEDGVGPSALVVCPWIGRHRRTSGGDAAYAAMKRSIDLLVVLLAAPIVGIVVLAAAAAIKLESPCGSLLHRQLRTGFQGSRFTVYKLRTMVPNAEAAKADLLHLNERTWPDFKITKDPRVLRTGRFFRRTGIDELPQLWNVFTGSMTLVGPRPTTLAPDAYRPWQLARFDARPGLTGLWQVSARTDPSFVQRIRLDLAYINRRSFFFDLEILLRTVVVTMQGQGT